MKHPFARAAFQLSAGLAAVFFLGCATTPPSGTTSEEDEEKVSLAAPAVAVACNTLHCVIDNATWQHIQARHCTGCVVGNKSAFVAAHCVDAAAATAFCNSVLSSPTCAAATQPNGRILATANLGAVVGDTRTACGNSNVGSVVFAAGGASVVTQFPGS